MALLLALNGRRVLLLEKGGNIGGSLVRFRRDGIPLDTGFHFTGGFAENGVLLDMLAVLGIADRIEPLYLSREEDNRVIFESSGNVYDMPPGYASVTARLKEYFPKEERAVDEFFRKVREVSDSTVAMNLRMITDSALPINEDFVSLEDAVSGLTANPELKALLYVFTMCCGTSPAEISFANYSRICYSLYKSVARVRGGGEAFIAAFRRQFAELDIEVRCNTYIAACEDVRDRFIHRFVLSSGEEVATDHCIFTVHPFEILRVLPEEHLTPAFRSRVADFESSAGFFSLYATVDARDGREPFRPAITSLFPGTDLSGHFDPEYRGDAPLVIVRGREQRKGEDCNVLNAFELSFPAHVSAWENSRHGARPAAYAEYKRKRVERIKQRIFARMPEFRDGFRVLDSASVLTFRDFLHSPHGCAYGVKQKIGQFNLFGRLPLRNTYAAGQNAVMPGIVGAMLSSFIVGRLLIGKENYRRFIDQRLDGEGL